jgi:hypothetical protein
MATRSATLDEERLIVAYHEAGHIVVTIFSEYFDLKDPAVNMIMDDEFGAIAAIARAGDTRDEPASSQSTREFVRISFAGRAAEDELSAKTEQQGRKVYPNPSGARSDLDRGRATLRDQDMLHEEEQLHGETEGLIRQHWKMVEEIANLLSTSQRPEISREDIVSLPSVDGHLTS